jgi:DNA-binding CsgD family transcriptional regulator
MVQSNSSDVLLDRIYEAALVPEVWPETLDLIASAGRCQGGTLFLVNTQQVMSWVASDSLAAIMKGWVEGRWHERSQRAPRMIALRHPGFVTDLDLYAPEELERQADYTEYLRPNGLGWGAGSFIPMPTGDVAVCTVERAYTDGPLGTRERAALDDLRPHIARAALMAVRLGLEKARSAVQALETVGLPAGLLRPDGRILVANGLLEQGAGAVSVGAQGQVVLASPAAQALLAKSLQSLPHRSLRSGKSIALARTAISPATVVHLLPVRRAAQDIFARAAALLVATPVAPSEAPDQEVLRALFDLTPAEARLAHSLLNGYSINTAAEELGLSRETLRSQLKHLLRKTGTPRQSELIRLLGGIHTDF